MSAVSGNTTVVWTEPEPALRLDCLGTPSEFTFAFELRDLWTFGFNFYGELGRDANILSMEPNQVPAAITQAFEGEAVLSVAA
eukprot:3243743-Rhodomonas_salina.1